MLRQISVRPKLDLLSVRAETECATPQNRPLPENPGTRFYYRSGTVNLKSFVDKVLLRIKWIFELTVYFKHEILGKL